MDPVTLQVMVGALRAACDEMGVVLVRSAHSANIKERRDAQRSVLLAGGELTREALGRETQALVERAREQLGAGDAEARVTAELRYRGQAFELSVAAGERPDPAELREAFHAAHEQAYGFRDPAGEVELVTLRLTTAEPGPAIDAAAAGARGRGAERSRRRAWLGGAEHDATVLTGEPEPGVEIAGPAICELPEATLAVPPGWAGAVLPSGTIKLERTAG